MGRRQFTNEASAILATTITSGSTTIALATGFGQYFPSPTGTEFFIVAVEDTSGNYEYIAITGRTTDTLTVAPISAAFPSGGRAQEGTLAQAFTMNLARVELRATAGLFSDLYQKDGDVLTGPMNMGGQAITNGVLGTGIIIAAAEEIINTPLRGQAGNATNEITVPTDGVSRAQAGGVDIVVKTDPVNAFTVGMIMMFNGSPTNLPAGWHVCDGGTYNFNTTPDLRDSFIVGAGNTFALGANGNLGFTTSAVSAARRRLIPSRLSVANLAAHAHPFDYAAGSGGVNYFGIPGYALPGDYIFNGSGTGGRNSFAGSSTGTGTAHTHTSAALAAHAHTVSVGPFYALYFAMFVGP